MWPSDTELRRCSFHESITCSRFEVRTDRIRPQIVCADTYAIRPHFTYLRPPPTTVPRQSNEGIRTLVRLDGRPAPTRTPHSTSTTLLEPRHIGAPGRSPADATTAPTRPASAGTSTNQPSRNQLPREPAAGQCPCEKTTGGGSRAGLRQPDPGQLEAISHSTPASTIG